MQFLIFIGRKTVNGFLATKISYLQHSFCTIIIHFCKSWFYLNDNPVMLTSVQILHNNYMIFPFAIYSYQQDPEASEQEGHTYNPAPFPLLLRPLLSSLSRPPCLSELSPWLGAHRHRLPQATGKVSSIVDAVGKGSSK